MTYKKPHVIALKGYSNSGKTTSLEAVVQYLTNQGKKVSVIKFIHRDNFSIDENGKDTWRMRQAGGDPIVSYSNDEIAIMTNKHLDVYQTIHLLHAVRDDLDYIFLEGFWENLYPKILFIKDLMDIETLLVQILGNPKGEDIIRTIFCLSGLYFLNPDFKQIDLVKKIKELGIKGILSSSLQEHLQILPILNIKNEPEKLIEVYKSFRIFKKNI